MGIENIPHLYKKYRMGMIMNLLRVSEAALEQYRQDSSLLGKRIFEDTLQAGNAEGQLYDIDKSWDGILFLLTGNNSSGQDHRLSRIFFSGQLIDPDQDLGYGPAHYHTPEQVRHFHEAIQHLSPQALGERFDAARMQEIGVYPNVWTHDDTKDYLTEYYETVQEAFSSAAQHNQALIIFIS